MPVGILRATLVVAASATLAACAHSTPVSKELAMTATTASSSTVPIEPVKQWPLKFKRHSFGVYSYDTYGCKVWYANTWQAMESDTKLQRSSDSYGPDYQRNWSGGHIDIKNFPPPAQVTWRSRDGQPHEALIDIGEIFKDQLIFHNVPREEMSDVPHGEYQFDPAILLEVNDRTIRVYMRAMIFLKRRVEVAGQMRADFRSDLVLVRTYTY
jgi:hypothetical protein